MTVTSGIGVDGLPRPLGELQAGSIYALSAPEAGLARALTVGTARAALAARRRMAIVVRDPLAICADLAAAGIDPVRAHKRGSLRVFAWTARSHQTARLGPAQLLDELDAFGCGGDVLVWLWPAHDALRWDHRPALSGFARLYHAWARMCRASMVFLFGEQGSGEGYAQQLADQYPPLAGLALVHGDAREAVWETRRWHGADTRLTGSLLRMQLGIDGRLHCPADLMADAENWRRRMLAADDRARVYVTRAAAEDDVDPSWSVLEDDDAVERRMNGAIAASAVFEINSRHTLRELAQRLHRLRIASGRGVRLLVCERGFRLRHGQTQLLLALGANAIVTPPQRIADVLELLRDIPYARALDADFETALRAAMPPAIGGYREPAAFATEAREIALRAQQAGLDCVLLSFMFAPGIDPAQARLHCRPSRSGDMFSVDSDTLHLFLYGCWSGDVEAALAHILRVPMEQLFDSQQRHTDFGSILAALDRIATHAADADKATATARNVTPVREVVAAPLAIREQPG